MKHNRVVFPSFLTPVQKVSFYPGCRFFQTAVTLCVGCTLDFLCNTWSSHICDKKHKQSSGGAVVLSILLFIIPILIYQISTNVFGADEIETGRNIGVGFSVFTMLLWGSTYIFRVATKDMTYAKQLKDYEDAVIQKRLEELDEDEVQALVEDIERDEF